jgi:hypothetical protein
MEKLRKSGRTRIAAFGAIALAIGAFASLAATGYAARIVAFAHTSPTAAQYPPSKVTICHHTHSQKNPFVTITVSVHALPAHLKHGDTIGPCQQNVPVSVAPVAKQKVHKAHKAKHNTGKSELRGHVKAAKTKTAKKPKKSNRGQSSVAPSSTQPTTGHGQGQGQGKAHGQAKGHAKTKSHDPAQGHGQGNGHSQGHGGGQGHGQGNGGGQGHGQGSGDTHGGKSGGGKGNGH